MTYLWLLNLDAEEELAALRAGVVWVARGESASAAARAAAARRLGAPLSEGGWLRAGDEVLGEGDAGGPQAAPRAADFIGVAWCPTPSAIAKLEARGATVQEHLAPVVLARANARETFAQLDPLPGSCICAGAHDVRAVVDRTAPDRSPGNERAPAWVLRHSLAASGRGRLVTEGWSVRVARWVATALTRGPVHAAPLVDVVMEFGLHGRVGRAGDVRLGRPITQRAWGGAFRSAAIAAADSLEGHELERLVAAAGRVGERLAEFGYRGPFGIDAFRWLDGAGRAHFHAPSEVNARYGMGFGIGAPELLLP